MENEEIKDLLEKNLAVSQEILKISKKTRRYILLGQMINVLKVLIIAVPIILGIIYLPPLVAKLMASYQDLLKGSGIENLGR